MVEMVTLLLLGEVASRYVQRSVRDDSETSAVRNLIGMVSAGLCVLCLLSVLRHHRYLYWDCESKENDLYFSDACFWC
jgi:hypothetical protein